MLFIPDTTFLEEIVKLFEVLASSLDDVILAGDVNIHMGILNSFNFIQHVNFPTNKFGHTLDIVATLDGGIHVSNLVSNQYDVSHHYLVDFCIQFTPELKVQKEISYRNSKSMDLAKFESNPHLSDTLSFGENVTLYNKKLSKVLNEHTPIKTKTIKIVQNAPWFDSECKNLRRLCHKVENQYKKTGLAVHKENYVSLHK